MFRDHETYRTNKASKNKGRGAHKRSLRREQKRQIELQARADRDEAKKQREAKRRAKAKKTEVKIAGLNSISSRKTREPFIKVKVRDLMEGIG
jgi:hypothetical protein